MPKYVHEKFLVLARNKFGWEAEMGAIFNEIKLFIGSGGMFVITVTGLPLLLLLITSWDRIFILDNIWE